MILFKFKLFFYYYRMYDILRKDKLLIKNIQTALGKPINNNNSFVNEKKFEEKIPKKTQAKHVKSVSTINKPHSYSTHTSIKKKEINDKNINIKNKIENTNNKNHTNKFKTTNTSFNKEKRTNSENRNIKKNVDNLKNQIKTEIKQEKKQFSKNHLNKMTYDRSKKYYIFN